MNVVFSVYGPDGLIRRTLDVPLRDAALNIGADERLIEGDLDAEAFYVRGGRVLPLPARPSAHATFLPVAGSWVDLRMASHRAADLETARAAASLPKSALLMALLEHRVLEAAEVTALAAGAVPPRLQALLNPADEGLRAVIVARWAQTEFGRLDPLIVVAAAKLGLADATLDEIFHVEAT